MTKFTNKPFLADLPTKLFYSRMMENNSFQVRYFHKQPQCIQQKPIFNIKIV